MRRRRSRRWRVLKSPSPAIVKAIPDAKALKAEVLGAEPSRWLPIYALVSGGLPLDEAATEAGGAVVFVQGDVEATVAGDVAFRLDSTDGVIAWIDNAPAPKGEAFTVPLKVGRHKLTLRVDTAIRKEKTVKAEVSKPPGTSAEFVVVGGK